MTIGVLGGLEGSATPGWLDPLAKTAPLVPCRTEDADLWFAEKAADLQRAKALCAECPARRACLAGALERRESWGVWGGEIFVDGAIVAYKRGRGRPRREDTTRAA